MNTTMTTIKTYITKTLALLLAASILTASTGYTASALQTVCSANQIKTFICFAGDGDTGNDPDTL